MRYPFLLASARFVELFQCLNIEPYFLFFVAWNTGTCLYMFWVGIACLVQCINTIIWNDNMVVKYIAWCDFCEYRT